MNSEEDRIEYLEPDYGYPREDDDEIFVEDVDEEDIRIEKLLEEQENSREEEKIDQLLDEQQRFHEKLSTRSEERRSPFSMSSNPFGGSSGGWTPGGRTRAPWENAPEEKKPWTPTGGGGWAGGSWSNTRPAEEKPAAAVPRNIRKRAVIVDLLDSLYESWDSGGRPNIMPRAMFDLKPKFDVWDKIASFAPEKVYVIFPAAELLPSLGDNSCRQATTDYITRCLSTYFRLDWRRGICFLHQMQKWTPKEKSLAGAIKDWAGGKEEIVYIGTHTGRWGLSSRDVEAARTCGLDYIDLYNLLDGKYEYEQ